jgi:membrane protease YdiL (CAAX protease family)
VNGLIGLGATLALLLLAGALIGAAARRHFEPRWLLVAALLVAVDDALLTRFYGALPNLLTGSDWNWQGKLTALAVLLAIAALPTFGWRRVGLTLRQAPGSLRTAIPVSVAYCAFFYAIALAFPNDPASGEDLAFQLLLPGTEEELFYRGLLLFAFDRAYTGRVRLLGVDWGWSAPFTSVLFGMVHAFGYSDGGFTFDAATMAMTSVPSLIAVWLRLRTGSLLLPVVLHDFGNLITMTV